MEPEQLRRKVLTLQACVRGFLVRRQFQKLRAEYEAIVQEIEGGLDTLQWTTGWIPRPQFLSKKAKSHHSWKAGKKISNPEQELWCYFPCTASEKEATWEEMVQKKLKESSASPCGDDSPWLQAEQGRKTKKSTQGDSKDNAISKMENPETIGPGLSDSQQELQELQSQRSHLAMELLWLQQAINSRKEYLILKQTLRSPEADHTGDKPSLCPDHGEKDYEKVWSQPDHLLQDQVCVHRTTGEPDHADDSYQNCTSQPYKPPESLATIDKTTAVAEGRNPFCRRAGPQLPPTSDRQGGGNRYNRGPNQGRHTFQGTCVQHTKLLEDKTPGSLKHRSSCSGKART
uniref:IQ domain-containing protein C n=1 Tax=Jaculus jaculus TaxID=51337 RepID=UPI001E1B1159|nr:IQ domain-containing protein C [Jaculus jaculus]